MSRSPERRRAALAAIRATREGEAKRNGEKLPCIVGYPLPGETIGKRSFDERQLVENYAMLIDEIMRAKPAAAKGRYIRGVTLATTMGPGIHVDPARVRGIVEDFEEEAQAAVPA